MIAQAGLTVADLAARRGGRLVFAGLGFAARPGEVITVTGANGSGKSTLLRLLAGLAAPHDGAIAWDGRNITDEPDQHRARIAYLGTADALAPTLTLAENLRFAAVLRGGAADLIDTAIDALALRDIADRPARQLSQGQRRRAALARLMVAQASLWLLDEPTIALDDFALGLLGQAIAKHYQSGGIAVIATHAALKVDAAADIHLGA
jgi:heme exporter protein A